MRVAGGPGTDWALVLPRRPLPIRGCAAGGYARLDMTEPAISIVVGTRDRPDSLARTLESLSGQHRVDFEVVVVDQSGDGRTRQVVERIARSDGRFSYLHLETPGLSRAYNVGIRSSSAPLLGFTDDDCVAPPDWLDSIHSAFASDPEVVLLYGQVTLPPGYGSDGDPHGDIPVLGITERRVLRRGLPFTLFGMGANFAARRRLFDLVGPFDEMLGGGGPLESAQDFDLMYRVYRSGHSTVLEPAVSVVHHGFRSSAQWPGTARSYGIGMGGFLVKHIRMGDMVAARLLARRLGIAGARLLKWRITARPVTTPAAYARGIVIGMSRSFEFSVDHTARVYRSRERHRRIRAWVHR
jgi:GT2 family glycosyltransferase